MLSTVLFALVAVSDLYVLLCQLKASRVRVCTSPVVGQFYSGSEFLVHVECGRIGPTVEKPTRKVQ
jgi:hypothetical protein